MSGSTPEPLSGLIADALGKIGLSMAALVVLSVFFGAVDELGGLQLLGLFVLHGIALAMLWKALQTVDANLAIGALCLGIAWNLGALLYLIDIAPTNIYGETKFDTKSSAEALLLAWWFGVSIRKIRKATKQKVN